MNAAVRKTVSEEVNYLIPSVLIDYLWGLADGEGAQSNHMFLLQKQVLGGRELQEIRHISNGVSMGSHKVFGFDPVDTAIVVEPWAGGLRMKSASLPETLEFFAATA